MMVLYKRLVTTLIFPKMLFHFRNGILAVIDGVDPSASHSLTLDSKTHKIIIAGQLSLVNGIETGLIETDGRTLEIEKMLEYLDPSIPDDDILGSTLIHFFLNDTD